VGKPLTITLHPESTRTFNGVRIRNRSKHAVQLDLETSNWLTEERERLGGKQRISDSGETEGD
jgi:hypothetical protein